MKKRQQSPVVPLVGHVRPAEANRLQIAMILMMVTGMTVTFFIAPSNGSANEIEAVSSIYVDENRTSYVNSIVGRAETRALIAGNGRTTAMSLGYTGKMVRSDEENELLEKAVAEDYKHYTDSTITATLDQGIVIGSIVGILIGASESPIGKTNFYGLRGSQWWLQETFQTNLEVRKTSSKVPVLDYTDTDGKRVVTPADLDGTAVTFSATQFTSPELILLGSVSRSVRNDRPPADSFSVEGRYFLTATKSALHGALSHFENVGEVEAITQNGSLVGNTIRGEWHQRLPSRTILMLGYRYHLETENPRAGDLATKQTGSDSIYTTFRWRFSKGQWTATSHELYGFGARYTTNVPTEAYVVGFGGKYQF